MHSYLTNWLYNSPAWLVTGVLLVASLAVALLLLLLAYSMTSKTTRAQHSELTSFTVNNITLLYAVLLAFIAVATWESYSTASDLAQMEAGLTGNLFRDTRGLPASISTGLRQQIGVYLQVVIQKEWPRQKEGVVPNDGWPILENVHEAIASINPENAGQAVLMQEMLRSLNELYKARANRLDAVRGHIPEMVWFVIVAVGLLIVAFTCFLQSERRIVHLAMVAGLTTSVILVIALIVELDYPFRGSISVSADPYRLVLEELGPTGAAGGG